MRSSLVALLALAIQATAPTWAAAGGSRTDEFPGACGNPPCSREELQRYERELIKRLQRANKLSAEARFRGETETADRLHRVFRRNFDRRAVVLKAINDRDRY